MKIVYLLRNPGIAHSSPEGSSSAVIAPGADGRYSNADLLELEDAEVVVVGLEPVNDQIFAAAPRLRLVQRLGAGFDNVDLAAAARHGVPVCNMPDFNAATVAEHAIMLMLALLRRVFESTLLMKASHWPLGAVVQGGLHDLQGQQVGIVGLGGIGLEVARRIRAFDARLLYADPRRAPASVESTLGLTRKTLDELLVESDIVTLHAPYTPENQHLIGRAEIDRMKRTAILINTARGALVDEDALVDALEHRRLRGAALDVFAEEPLPATHALRRCSNVLLTPHVAGQTREAMDRMVAMMRENIDRGVRNERPLYQVDAGN